MTNALNAKTANQNIGKKVVFLEDTKPYENALGVLPKHIQDGISELEIKSKVDEDGDVPLINEQGVLIVFIHPKHLALAENPSKEMSIQDVISLTKSNYELLPSWVKGAYQAENLFFSEGELLVNTPQDMILNARKGVITPHEKAGFVTWLDEEEQENLVLQSALKTNDIQSATHYGEKSQLFALKTDDVMFLFLNGQWIECGYLDDEFVEINMGIDLCEDKKQSYSDGEIELIERIAMKLLEVHKDIDGLDHIFKGITGK